MLYMQSDSSSSYFTSCYWLLLYRVILCSRADSLRLHVILHEWIAFYSALFPYQSGVLTALAWLVPHETAAISTCSVYTIQPCTMSLHAKPHMWGTSRFGCNLSPVLLAEWMDLLHDTAVTRGGMDTELRVSTESLPWRIKFTCHFCRDSNLWPFDHESSTPATELSPLSAIWCKGFQQIKNGRSRQRFPDTTECRGSLGWKDFV